MNFKSVSWPRKSISIRWCTTQRVQTPTHPRHLSHTPGRDASLASLLGLDGRLFHQSAQLLVLCGQVTGSRENARLQEKRIVKKHLPQIAKSARCLSSDASLRSSRADQNIDILAEVAVGMCLDDLLDCTTRVHLLPRRHLDVAVRVAGEVVVVEAWLRGWSVVDILGSSA